ncbi:unnamed protein product [Clavelina lepadiformis]|uniref:Uncharacterized protein n=1 Tax=Clavelina lepadiformis TaxID=159417 RepID=A0ABP0FC65_CLALP
MKLVLMLVLLACLACACFSDRRISGKQMLRHGRKKISLTDFKYYCSKSAYCLYDVRTRTQKPCSKFSGKYLCLFCRREIGCNGRSSGPL